MNLFHNKHIPQTANISRGHPGIVWGLWLALLVAPLGAQETTGPLPPGRFLFLVDTSASMRGRVTGLVQTLESLLASDLDGRLRSGDTLGLWTFNESVYAGRFPLQTWSPAQRAVVTSNMVEFIRQQRYERRTDLDKALARAFPLVRDSPAITLILFTDGDEMMRGTPFDDAINAVFRESRRTQSRARMPFVTVLRAEGGRLVNHVVGQPPWRFDIPLLPIEQAALEAAAIPKEETPEAKRPAALEAAQAGEPPPVTKPKPAATPVSKPTQTEPAPRPAEIPEPTPGPPAPVPPAVVKPDVLETEPPPATPPAPVPLPAAAVSPADSPVTEPQRPEPGLVIPDQALLEGSAAPVLKARQPDQPAPLTAPQEVPKPAEVLSQPAVPKPEVPQPVTPPAPVVETIPTVDAVTPPPQPATLTDFVPVETPPRVIEQPAVELAAPGVAESPVTPVSVEPPVQTAAAIPPQSFPGGTMLLVAGLLLLGVACGLFMLIVRRSRGRAAAGSLITQSLDRDRDQP